MVEIVICSRYGKKIAEPFAVNTPEAMPEEEINTNSSQAEVAANQDTEAAADVQAD